jgi:RHS repeat-associated protein
VKAPGLYRGFGFNGKLKDNEIAGAGNSLDFGARIYNPRIARFNSRDPLGNATSFQSPYLFANNSPISRVDFNGLFGVVVTEEAQRAGVNSINLQNFNRVVANIGKILDANPAVLKKMVEQTGISENEIKGWMKYGEGPQIFILGVGETGNVAARGNKNGLYFDASSILDLATYDESDELYSAMNYIVLHYSQLQ